MRKVRTTIQPHVEIEVSDTEYLDLQRQGLLIEARRQPAESSSASAAAPAPTPASSGKSSKES